MARQISVRTLATGSSSLKVNCTVTHYPAGAAGHAEKMSQQCSAEPLTIYGVNHFTNGSSALLYRGSHPDPRRMHDFVGHLSILAFQ